MHKKANRTASRLILTLLLATSAHAAEAADPTRTARLVLGAGLLGDADRAQRLYVTELIRLEVPDDGDDSLVIAIRSMFPPGQIRERWIGHLADQLSEDELNAAESFYGSVPGRELGMALRKVSRTPAAERALPEANSREAFGDVLHAMEVPAREGVLRVRTAGAALWTSRLLDGDTETGPDAAVQDALAALTSSERDDELLAFEQVPQIYTLGLLEYAESSLGRRFFAKFSAAFDITLEEMMSTHLGNLTRAANRREAAREESASPSIQIDPGT